MTAVIIVVAAILIVVVGYGAYKLGRRGNRPDVESRRLSSNSVTMSRK